MYLVGLFFKVEVVMAAVVREHLLCALQFKRTCLQPFHLFGFYFIHWVVLVTKADFALN